MLNTDGNVCVDTEKQGAKAKANGGVTKCLNRLFEVLDVGNISVNVLRGCLASEHAGSPAEIEHMRLKLRHTLQIHFDHYVHSPEIQLEDFGGGGAAGGGAAVQQQQQLVFSDSDEDEVDEDDEDDGGGASD